MRWDDPRLRVVKLAGASYREEALQDDAFAPGRRLGDLPSNSNIVIRSNSRIREALELVRSAATQPDCRFRDPERLTALSRPDLPMMDILAKYVETLLASRAVPATSATAPKSRLTISKLRDEGF